MSQDCASRAYGDVASPGPLGFSKTALPAAARVHIPGWRVWVAPGTSASRPEAQFITHETQWEGQCVGPCVPQGAAWSQVP